MLLRFRSIEKSDHWRKAGILQLPERGAERDPRVAILPPVGKQHSRSSACSRPELRARGKGHPPEVMPAGQAARQPVVA